MSLQMVWIIDFNGYEARHSPPLVTSRETMRILQTLYPERLGAAVLINAPQAFKVFFERAFIYGFPNFVFGIYTELKKPTIPFLLHRSD